MRRYVVAVALLLAAGGPAGVPAHADHDRFLTISGDGAGYADVRFPEPFTLDGNLTRYTTSGRVAGFYVRRVGARAGEPYAMGVSVRGIPVVGGSPRLPAGTYRVYLVADGPATVRVLARGAARDVAARVRHRRALSLDVGRMDVRPDTPARHRGARSMRVRGGNTFAVAMYAMDLDPATPGWGGVTPCLAPDAAMCERATDGIAPDDVGTRYGWQSFPPGSIPAPTGLHQRYAGTARADVTTASLELSL